MPIPKPVPNENRNEFMARCMANKLMIAEYPNEEQRRAVCATFWRESAEQ